MTSHNNSSIPTADPTGHDPAAFGDALLNQGHTLVRTPQGEVLVLGNELVREVAEDAKTYSSAVSAHLQIPNGLDGEEHTQFRALIERYLNPSALASAEEDFFSVAAETAEKYVGKVGVDAVSEVGTHFAVNAMLAWLGWPEEMASRLVQWVANNAWATRSGKRSNTAAVAEEFDQLIREVVQPRYENPGNDVTSQLIHDEFLGRSLTFDEVVSILRNWTGGDLSSMAYCVGVILHGLGQAPELQERLRQDISEHEYNAILDELLRRDSPFVSNRRITTCPVSLGGHTLDEGQRLRVVWTAANRDPDIVVKPDEFNVEKNAGHNLVWGAGPHVCPGRTLSMMELRALTTTLLARADVHLAGEGNREVYPSGGWAEMPVTLNPR